MIPFGVFCRVIAKHTGYQLLTKLLGPRISFTVSRMLFFKKVTGSYKWLTVFEQMAKEELKMAFGNLNYLRFALKFNIKTIAQRLVLNRTNFHLVKLIKMINLLYKIDIRLAKEEAIKTTFDILSKQKFKSGVLEIDQENVKPVLETLKYLRSDPRVCKQAMKDLNEISIVFEVNSPQTQNFSQGVHRYNFKTKDYIIPIRSGSHKYVRTYTYFNINPALVIDSLLGLDFGKIVFNIMRHCV